LQRLDSKAEVFEDLPNSSPYFSIFLYIFTTAYCVTLSSGQGPPVYSIALESELRDELFKNYSALQRPAKTVNVKVDLTLLTVNDLVSYVDKRDN
jgi:hypothetical protein